MTTTRTSCSLILVLLLAAGACGGKQTTAGPVEEPIGPAPEAADGAGAGDPSFPEEAFRANRPAPTAPRPFQLPAIKRFQIGKADKIDVYLVERHELPTISIDLDLDGGSMTDPAGKVGLASVCMDMLAEGTVKLDKIAFNEALADVASNVSSYAGDDTQGVSMRTLTKNFDQTFALFADTILQPAFRKAEFDRMIQRRLESLKQSRGSATAVAARLGGLVRYGASHPFGRVTSEKGYKAIRLSDCKAYHKRWIRPGKARLFVVGDTTEEKIRAAVTPLLAKWRGAAPALKAPPKPSPIKDGRIVLVDVPDSAQSVVVMMHLGPARKAADYFPTTIMGLLLGGGFTSRINMNLRESKGYAYGAGGGFSYSKWFGAFRASGSVRDDATYQSILELLGEVRGLQDATRPPTPEELEREKEGSILAMPARFATATVTLGQYRALVYFGLPLDYWNTYVDNVKAVTGDQVKAAAQTHLKPADAIYLVVGDASKLQKKFVPGGEDGKGSNQDLVGDDGKPLALREALVKLLGSGELGSGQMYVLDVDGKVVKKIAIPRQHAPQPAGSPSGVVR
ncbi:MAG TPA: pitrilysin family protein [Kofleriaceae bacterium]|nr:pitrilysin family protein [Kofleriaceae bacterium]